MWVDPWGWCSIKLSNNMIKKGIIRPKNSAAHHIVGDTSKRALPARTILKKHGIDIDSAENGVFLPNRNNKDGMSGIVHNGRHPKEYYDAVDKRIINADKEGGKKGVLEELDKIRDILSNADNNSSWYTIL